VTVYKHSQSVAEDYKPAQTDRIMAAASFDFSFQRGKHAGDLSKIHRGVASPAFPTWQWGKIPTEDEARQYMTNPKAPSFDQSFHVFHST
jgi:hypothetical protein